jgi:hypothetical protein
MLIAGVPKDLYAAYPAVRAFHKKIASLPEVSAHEICLRACQMEIRI